ncbi:MAG: hypothetical protein JWP81_1446 [Ferruginibacter sp.]|nr:hypothetical protein [Ferruginibacter sp.]
MDTDIKWLFIIPLGIACISWTVTHEEVFREPREYCLKQSQQCRTLLQRKFFYLFTCEYCFSHYVTVVLLFLTQFKLMADDWRGYIISGFALVWIANIYMSLFALIRQNVKIIRIRSQFEEEILEENDNKKSAPAQQQDIIN